MNRFLCCFKGQQAGPAVQEPPQPQLSPDQRSFSGPYPSAPVLPENGVASLPWQAIVDGTLNFRRTQSLGKGDFGEVFRCDLPSINRVGAAKIQISTSQAAHLEFIAEVTMLHEADHPNVITLLGKCYEPTHRALVYDFMLRGSLDHYLTDMGPCHRLPQATDRVLDWETRMRIAVGVARGLGYVHTTLKAVHRDIKAGNILLDQNFEPKLTDFGLATRIVECQGGFDIESTINIIKGTMGYIAPETRFHGRVSTKSDVYSYGVLLIQLFTRKKPLDSERPDATKHLADWFLSVYHPTEEHRGLLTDATLWPKYSIEGFRRVLRIAWQCVSEDPHARPNMNVVETMIVDAAACPIPESTASSSNV